MSDAATHRWTVEDFFAWQETQSERYELVGGVPVRMMAGARNVHDDIVVNVLGELRNQLRGSGCRPFIGDGSIETLPGQIRRPDIGVDCGRRDPNALRAALPRMVAEVLSPSTRDFDTIEKLDEYKRVESIDYVLVIEPNAPEVIVWSRTPDRSWERDRIVGLDGSVELRSIGVALALRDVYEGVEFSAGPRLVCGEPGDSGQSGVEP